MSVIPPTVTFPTCLRCGMPLIIPDDALLDPQNAPWLCETDQARFWNAELTADARANYRMRQWDFGLVVGPAIQQATVAEAATAATNGCSVLTEHFSLLTTAQMQILSTRLGLSDTLQVAVDAAAVA